MKAKKERSRPFGLWSYVALMTLAFVPVLISIGREWRLGPAIILTAGVSLTLLYDEAEPNTRTRILFGTVFALLAISIAIASSLVASPYLARNGEITALILCAVANCFGKDYGFAIY
jgi:hypothetical protein